MTPEIRQGIIATAQQLGMNPLDLATIISYETGGTFDPMQAGPTTQWGRHRGLIQFGEPQARQYGVDWRDPLRSQLGPDGAVSRYFVDRGWKPGMGILDAYSIVNAGAPGRYGASDANNGGAPGTVADKVRDQFAPHRAKAARLLGFSMADGSTADPYTPQNALAGFPGAVPGNAPAAPPAPPTPQLAMLDPRAFQRDPQPVNLLGFV